MAGRHRSGRSSKGLAQRKGGGRRKHADRREPYRWLGAGAVTIGMGLAMANGAGIAHAEEGGSEGSSASVGGSDGGGSAGESGNAGGASTNTGTSHASPADSGDESDDEDNDLVQPESSGQGSADSIGADVGDELGDGDGGDDEVLDGPPAVLKDLSPTSGSGHLADRGVPGSGGSSNPLSQNDDQVARGSGLVNDPPPPLQAGAGALTKRTLVEPEIGATNRADESFVPTASVVATTNQIEATVAVTAVNPQPVEFRPVRSLVSWVLSVFGYNPNNPGVSPNPFLEAAWALYRRTESFFFNQAPSVGTAQVLDTSVGADGSVVVTGTLNVSDFNGDAVRFSATNGQSGHVQVSTNGTFTYTAAAGFTGSDTFTLVASDSGSFHLLSFLQPGGAHTTTATVRITVVPVGENNAPVIGEPGFAVSVINRRTGAVSGTVDVTDPDDDTLTYSLAGSLDPAIGEVTVDSVTGAWKFTPTAEARLAVWSDPSIEPVSFVIVATDGLAAVTVAVTAAVDPAARYTLESIYGGEQESWGNQGLAIGVDGRIYLTTYLLDDTAGEIVVLNADGTYATTIELPTDASHPYATAFDVVVGPDGRVFVSGESAETAQDLAEETGRGFVAVIDPDDYSISVLAYTSDPASAITTDADDGILVANWNNDTITVLNPDGTVDSLIESAELFDEDDSGVAGIAVGPDGLVYLTKPSLGVVKVIDADGDTVRIVELGGKPWAIAVAANGLAYVTDFETSGVSVLNAAGNVVRTLRLPEGARPSDITIGQDGRIQVSYLGAEGGAIAVFTALPIGAPEATVIGDVLTGTPGSQNNPVQPVRATDVVYQTTTGVDPSTGLPRTTVGIIDGDGVTTLVFAAGEPVGAPVLGLDDVAYQTVSYFDAEADIYRSGVLAVKPDGTSIFTGLFEGQPAGAVVLGVGDRAYQVVYSEGDDQNSYVTTVLEITAAGVTTRTIDGYPGSFVLWENSGPVVAADGTVYLTTTSFTGDDFTVRVAIWGAGSFAVHSAPGFASGPVSIALNGTVYQLIGTVQTDTDSGEYTATTALAVVTGTGITVLTDTVGGLPLGSPVIAGETGYHLLYDFSSDGTPGTATLVSLTETGLTVVDGGIPGIPTAADGSLIRPVVGSDGTTYFTLTGDSDTFSDYDGPVTLVVAVSVAGEVRGALVVGEPIGAVAMGADGVSYQTTYDAATSTTAVTVITATDETRHEFSGYPGDPDGSSPIQVVTGPDGTAYQVISYRDAVTGEYTATVAVITAAGLVATSSFDGQPSGPVVVGADGRAYLTVSRFNTAVQITLTAVLTIDETGELQLVRTLRGNPAGTLTFGPGGVAYQTVLVDEGYGEVTAVHALDASVFEFDLGARAQSIGALSVVSGNIHIIDDAYLASFYAADPTSRFEYTRYMASLRGQTTDQTPLTGAQLDSWLAANASYLNQLGTTGFARDAQGRLIYRNTSAQDVLVVYGANPNTNAPLRAILVRSGTAETLPAGLEGAFAASQRLGHEEFDALVYRGAAATPVATPTPKKSPVSKNPPVETEKMRAYDLVDGLPGSDQITIEITTRNGENRMVVYLGGVIPDNGMSWIESLQLRSLAHIPDDVNKFIDRHMDQYKPKEIMLVGYSKGGLIAQNYAAGGKHREKVKVVVTFATGIITNPSNNHQSIHFADSADPVVRSFNRHGTWEYLRNLGAGRIYETPDTHVSDKHSTESYRKAAEYFEWDAKWTSVKNAMRSFEGEYKRGATLVYRI